MYKSPDMAVWQGRIDDTKNYDAFRWHQWIEPLDLMSNLSPITSDWFGVAFIGFMSDEGVSRNLGRSGAKLGPLSIRKELRNLPCSFLQTFKLYDAGDIVCEGSDLEAAQDALSQAVNRIIELGLFPIVLGGGHEVALGTYMGTHHAYKQSIGIINFDAHFDIRPYTEGGSSGTMFRQIADFCASENELFSYFCIGIQKRGNTIDLFKTADRLGVEYLMAKDIGEGDLDHAFTKLDTFIARQDKLYVTICSDVFSSAFAPGVSAAQPLGLHPERILRFFKHIFKTGKVVAFDVAEVAPRFDFDNTTANLAATFIFSAINALASIHKMSYR